jgi:hypothetical protein
VGFVYRWNRRRAIKKYINVLGPALKKSYGVKRTYSPGEVGAIIDEKKLSTKYVFYALVLFCSKKDCNDYVQPNQANYSVLEYASARSVALNIAITQSVWSGGNDGSNSASADYDSSGD